MRHKVFSIVVSGGGMLPLSAAGNHPNIIMLFYAVRMQLILGTLQKWRSTKSFIQLWGSYICIWFPGGLHRRFSYSTLVFIYWQ